MAAESNRKPAAEKNRPKAAGKAAQRLSYFAQTA
jgi:hypothetical protein